MKRVRAFQDRLAAAPAPGLVERIAEAALGDPLAHPIVKALVAAEQQVRWVQWGAVGAGVAACLTGLVVWLGVPGFTTASEFRSRAAGVTSLASTTAALPAASPSMVDAGLPLAGLPFRTNAVPFLLRVVAGPESRPVAGARVFAHYVIGADWIPLSGLQTDADGLCSVPLPAGNLARLDVAADRPGFGTRSFKWMTQWGTPRPANYILRLQPGTAIGGVVLGTNGAPLAYTAVTIAYNNSDSNWDDPELAVGRPGPGSILLEAEPTDWIHPRLNLAFVMARLELSDHRGLIAPFPQIVGMFHPEARLDRTFPSQPDPSSLPFDPGRRCSASRGILERPWVS